MDFDNEFLALDEYGFVSSFLPDFVKDKYNFQYNIPYRWSQIKCSISNGEYATNTELYERDYDFIKDWFGLIALCINRLGQKDFLEVVRAMKSISEYFDNVTVMHEFS